MKILATFWCVLFAVAVFGYNTAHATGAENSTDGAQLLANDTETGNSTITVSPSTTTLNSTTLSSTTMSSTTLNTTTTTTTTVTTPTTSTTTTTTTSTASPSTTMNSTTSTTTTTTTASTTTQNITASPKTVNDGPAVKINGTTENNKTNPSNPLQTNKPESPLVDHTAQPSSTTPLNNPPPSKSNSGGIVAGVIIGIAALFVLVCLVRRKLRNDRRRDAQRQHLFRNPIKFEEDSIL